MKLNCILSAVDNSLYLEYIPIFINTWKHFYPNVDIKIILISYEIPEKYNMYIDYFILFKPIKNIFTSFTAQFIRLLYPCILNYNDGIMITDIDMIPMNYVYFTNSIVSYNNTQFISYRDCCLDNNEIAMCYNIATSIVWRDIFEIKSLEDINERLKIIFNSNNIKKGRGNIGWNIDQKYLYAKLFNWKEKKHVILSDKTTKFNRLCRSKFKELNIDIIQNIQNNKYTDFHCFRSDNKNINQQIYDLIKYKSTNL